jgi:hypothetical protein
MYQENPVGPNDRAFFKEHRLVSRQLEEAQKELGRLKRENTYLKERIKKTDELVTTLTNPTSDFSLTNPITQEGNPAPAPTAYYYIPITDVTLRMKSARYEKVLGSFIALNFKVKFDTVAKNHRVFFDPNKPAACLDFKMYKRIVQDAYDHSYLGGNQRGELALDLFNFINYTKNVLLRSVPEDLQVIVKIKKEILFAFDHEKMCELSTLLFAYQEQTKKYHSVQ